jgi:hypothetical protein
VFDSFHLAGLRFYAQILYFYPEIESHELMVWLFSENARRKSPALTRASAKFWHAGRCTLNPAYRHKIQLTGHQSCFPDFQFQHQLMPEIHSDIPSFR